jgi:cell division protein FtsB
MVEFEMLNKRKIEEKEREIENLKQENENLKQQIENYQKRYEQILPPNVVEENDIVTQLQNIIN